MSHMTHCETCICGKRAPVQDQRGLAGAPNMPEGTISWEEYLEVYARYAALYGTSQSAERLAERGGFGYYEAQKLLGRPLRTWRP